MQQITIKRPSDMHTHVRQGENMKELVKITAMHFQNVLVMPNTTPAKTTGEMASLYVREIELYAPETNFIGTIKITPETTEETIKTALACKIRVGKLYFGITTNEAEGARGIEPYLSALAAMEEHGMILCIHGEMAYDENGKKIINLRREEAFIPIAQRIIKEFPDLRIVMEHITTEAMMQFVWHAPDNVAATITVQHLRDDIDAVLGFTTPAGEGINPHNYCKPVQKMPEDREALVQAAVSGNPKFFFGSDSAPHTTDTKECCCGKPGVFSALTRIETLAEIFEERKLLHKLEGFLSIFGPRFYGLPETAETITLEKNPWKVDDKYGAFTNYRSGEEIDWRVV